MNNLYSNNFILDLKKKKKRSTIIVITLMVSATLLNVSLLFVSKEENRGLMQFILSTIYVICGWISLYLLFTGIFSLRKKIMTITNILDGEKIELDGTVESINKPLTLANSDRCYEIMIMKDRVTHKVYYDELFGNVPFNKGDTVRLNVSNNYIVGYEVIQND